MEHTISLCDWSSDVCSSDLLKKLSPAGAAKTKVPRLNWGFVEPWHFRFGGTRWGQLLEVLWALVMVLGVIFVLSEGATLDRKSCVWGLCGAVRERWCSGVSE